MDDNRLKEIALKYGTPAYLFDEKALKDRMRCVRDIVGDGIKVCYSIKANPFLIPAMLEVTDALEVCSPGELDICKSLKVPGSRIVYSGVNKTRENIRDAVSYDCGIYTAESLKHVELLHEEAVKTGKELKVILRLNGGCQFGMSKEDLFKALENRDRLRGVDICGIHYFVGTQRKKLKDRIDELRMLEDLFDEIEERFAVRLERLEYGPGLPVPYFENENFEDTLLPLKEVADALKEISKKVNLTVEMGRFFSSECGYYLSRVMDIKSNKGTNYLIIDGGMNHLTYFGQVMGMKIPVIRHLSVDDGSGPDAGILDRPKYSGKQDYCLCGSLCTTADVVVRQVPFEDIKEGDVLAFCNAGAYSVTEGIHLFLSRTMPIILLSDDEMKVRVARDFLESSTINTIKEN